VQYGRSETKRAITNVLEVVLKNSKYSSLPELNAVLQQNLALLPKYLANFITLWLLFVGQNS